MQETLGLLSGALVPCASVIYAWAVFRRKIIPAKATWIVWTLLATLTSLGMYAEDSLNYQIVMVALGDLVVLCLAFRYGESWSWTKIDMICLISAGISIMLWQVTGDATLAIILLLAATSIGFVPMLPPLWVNPNVEKPTAWFIMLASSVLLLLSLEKWTIASAAQPVVYLVIPVVVLLMIYRPRPALA